MPAGRQQLSPGLASFNKLCTAKHSKAQRGSQIGCQSCDRLNLSHCATHSLSRCAAGMLGGVVNVLLRPVFNLLHLSGTHGLLFHMHLPFSASDLYHQAFWGALWGLLLCVPLHKYLRYFWARAFLFGALLPTTSATASLELAVMGGAKRARAEAQHRPQT
jgi:hypothetical protein